MSSEIKLKEHTCFGKQICISLAVVATISSPIQTQAQTESLLVDSAGQVGVGTSAPARQLHMVGDDAVFRMDRTTNAASFLFVRTDPGTGDVLKTFLVGSTGGPVGVGQFIINDLGTAVAGGGPRRMTIFNSGDVDFPGDLTAASFTGVVNDTSSQRFKNNIASISGASDKLENLRGVSFTWKESGKASLGVVAEEVLDVLPELVSRDREDEITAVNYSGLVAVLIEAFKEQKTLSDISKAELSAQADEIENQKAQIAALEGRLQGFEEIVAKLGILATNPEFALNTSAE
ncbi:tail fiber domain-containing protein [Pseudomonadota bacterium]